ncbi:APC family permease [Actinospica robiniae]|uniref:APC family permease n=1 Tax=Actinospica robiniae TaxID=304901 RepID=UPI00041DC8EE|nr:APC family permease [Actinospica robiniae]
MVQTTAAAPPGAIPQGLARGKLNAPMVSFFMIASLGPLLVCAGTLPSSIGATGLTSFPAAFVLTALILGMFAPGYLAMSRHVVNAGAFYALITRGLGRPAGVAGALVAFVGYSGMQCSLYGIIGVQGAAFVADNSTWHPSWWACALAAWVLVGTLGLVQVELSGRLLGVLSVTEILVILAISMAGLAHPADGRTHPGALNPSHLTAGSLGPLAAICVLCFLGFEQSVVYGEEARRPRTTLLRASVVSLSVAAVIYVGASLAVDMHYGKSVVAEAQARGPELFLAMSPGLLSDCADVLFLTSLFAAALAYHNTLIRYGYSLGRDGVLPQALATVRRSGIPRTASLLQSAIGLGAILATLTFQWDPMTQLFYLASTTGGYAIMVLLAVTAVAVVVFFARDHRGEPGAVRLWLPGIAAAALIGMVWACTANLSGLLGISPSDPTIDRVFILLGGTAVLGFGWALALKLTRPSIYAALAPILTEVAA